MPLIFPLNGSSVYCVWYGLLLCTCRPHNLNISYVICHKMQKCRETLSTKLLGVWPRGSVMFMGCLCSYGYRHCKIHLSATKLSCFKICYCGTYWWKDKDSVQWILDWSVGIFWQNWQFFKLREALGRLCFLDYISLYYALHTILANCPKLGDTARDMKSVYSCLPRMPLEELRWDPQT